MSLFSLLFFFSVFLFFFVYVLNTDKYYLLGSTLLLSTCDSEGYDISIKYSQVSLWTFSQSTEIFILFIHFFKQNSSSVMFLENATVSQ